MQSDDLTRARMWLVITTLVLAVVLMVLSGLSWHRTNSAYHAMVIAQGNLLLSDVRQTVRGSTPAPPEALLDGLLRQHAADGLAWVGFLRRDGTVATQVGQPPRERFDPMPREGMLIEDGPRMLLATMPASPAHTSIGERQGPPPGPPPGPIVIAFHPTLAAGLQRGAASTFLLSVIASVVFGGIAFYAWRESQRAQLQAEQEARRERLASLGEMSAVLAHEIRNPLAALKGHAQLLMETTPDMSRTHKRAQRIVRATSRLQAIADGLLDFVRLGEVHREQLNPAGLMQSAVDEAAPHAHLHTDQAPALWSLDATRMFQVFTNLLRNAAEASGPEGTIDVHLREEGGRLVIEVADSGTGIDPDILPTIFEPFRTTKTRGTGLGLAVCQRIAELHGGTLTAANRPDAGAVFHLTIP